MDIENDACVFRGLKSSVNFLIATLKRFLDILSIFSDKHLPSFDPYSCEIDLSLFYHHYFKEIYKWSLSTLIDMAIQFYNNTLFWQFKFWSGFCWSGRALVSFWAGNCQPDLATLEVTLRAVLTSFSEAADVHVRSCPSSKQTRASAPYINTATCRSHI